MRSCTLLVTVGHRDGPAAATAHAAMRSGTTDGPVLQLHGADPMTSGFSPIVLTAPRADTSADADTDDRDGQLTAIAERAERRVTRHRRGAPGPSPSAGRGGRHHRRRPGSAIRRSPSPGRPRHASFRVHGVLPEEVCRRTRHAIGRTSAGAPDQLAATIQPTRQTFRCAGEAVRRPRRSRSRLGTAGRGWRDAGRPRPLSESASIRARAPLQQQIYDGSLGDLTEFGLQPRRARVPSSRALSRACVSSRRTLLAFDPLIAEGYCVTRPGAGTSDAPDLPDNLAARPRRLAAAHGAASAALGSRHGAGRHASREAWRLAGGPRPFRSRHAGGGPAASQLVVAADRAAATIGQSVAVRLRRMAAAARGDRHARAARARYAVLGGAGGDRRWRAGWPGPDGAAAARSWRRRLDRRSPAIRARRAR